MASNADVLIVGGGPVGLALANVLGGMEVDVLVVDQDPGVATLPRAVSIDDEAMRFMQAIGLFEETRKISIAGTGTRYYGAGGRPLSYARGVRHPLNGHPIKNLLDHSEFQQMLLDGLDRFPSVTARHSTRLTGLRVEADGVIGVLAGEDGAAESVAAAYVVGCDGGRSTVRRQLDIQMLGTSSPERWLVIDTINDPHRERYAMHHGDPVRPHVIIIGRDGRCRYEFLLADDEQPGEDELLGLAEACLAPYRALPREDVVRCVVYTFHSLVAESWRQGRVLLAGDAAHMMPPFAGQGLNSGLRDAFNLGWKLGLTVEGRCSPRLLDSYEVERRPHVEAMLRLSVRLGKVMMTRSRARARLRDLSVRVGQAVPPVHRFFAEMRFKPAAEYAAGFKIGGPGAGAPIGALLAQPRVYLADGSYAALDDLLGAGFALLAVNLPPTGLEEVDAGLWDRLGVTRFLLCTGDLVPDDHGDWRAITDEDGSLQQQLAGFDGQVLLIRPDRFVVGAFAPAEEEAFARQVQEACIDDDTPAEDGAVSGPSIRDAAK